MEFARQPLQAQDQDRGGDRSAHRRAAAQAQSDHVSRRVRRRASGSLAASALRQEQGRPSGREPDRRSPYRQGTLSAARAAGSARAEPRGLRDRRLCHHRSRADAVEESVADQAGYLRQGLRISGERLAPENAGRTRRHSQLWRRDHLHAGRLRFLVEPVDRGVAAVAAHRKADDADGGGRSHLRQAAPHARYARRAARSCRRRHHRRYVYLCQHDRRPDQDADDQRLVRP